MSCSGFSKLNPTECCSHSIRFFTLVIVCLYFYYIEVWKSPKRHLSPGWMAGIKWRGTRTRHLFTNTTENRVTTGRGIHHRPPVVPPVQQPKRAGQGLPAMAGPWGPPRPWWPPRAVGHGLPFPWKTWNSNILYVRHQQCKTIKQEFYIVYLSMDELHHPNFD